MKKIVSFVTAVSLMSIAACSKSPEAASVENNADMMADNMELMADNIDAMADDAANAMEAAALRNASVNFDDGAGNVRDIGEGMTNNLQ